MATPVQINSFSLQDSSINVTSIVLHDSGNEQQLNIMDIARRDGGKLISSNFTAKSISIEGIIKGTSQSDLETNIDSFKQNVYVTDGNLDISYAGGFRRYNINTQNIAITREHFHNTFAPFSINLVVLDPPFGQDIASAGASSTTLTEAFSVENLTENSTSWDRTYLGTAKPKPTIE